MSESFVIDNSIVMAWCFMDEGDPYADAVLGRLEGATAYVPAIWPLEVVNVLLMAERRGRLSQADSSRFITLLAQLPIVVEHERIENRLNDILTLARAHALSSYDAAYLDLSVRRGLPLATADARLLGAAATINVPILLRA